MEWTREERYRSLDEIDEIEMKKLTSKVNNCIWRQQYHIQPPTGLLNDPNGFSYFNGEYHLFYQWFPLGPVHGLKYWYHTKSKDLVNWENVGIGLKPNSYFDSHGAYSGSAIEHNEKLYLFYTGNTRDEDWVRHPYQCLAVMDKQNTITKLDNPVIKDVPDGFTDHFRDPKVWKEGERFYAVIGAQRTNDTGCIVLYSSFNLIDWQFEGEITTHLDTFGFMWECPDYFELQNAGVLVFSPQGLEPHGDKYHNIYQSGYILGEKMNVENRTFNHGEFIELDRGFDFYAPQTMVDPNGRRILVAWMGLPEINYPTDASGWAHCLTLPRELKIRNGKLYQTPVKELKALRKEESKVADRLHNETKEYADFTGVSYEMIGEFDNIDASAFGIEFRAGDEEKTVLSYDVENKKVILDRKNAGQAVGEAYGTKRKCRIDSEKIKFHLFVDTSSVEIFINDGEEVFTSRIFPSEDSNTIRFFASGGSVTMKVVKWDI